MPNGGAITIEAGEVDTQDLSEGGLVQSGYVCLAVSDIGTGMDAITLAKAQEPFFTTKGVGKGTGLGLSMVQGLAEQSKGRLVLISESGVGTRAEIWLPVAEQIADSQEKAEKRSSAPLIESLTVLVVDDDALVLENTAAMLEDLGHRVHEARSGEEALEIVSRVEGLDLVISDQAMPGMTGAELLERLRQMRPELSIILATGYAELPAGTAAGVVKLSKPFDQRALATGIHSALHVPKPVSKVVAFPSKRRS
jgi:CheY-like chemotaxis protein